MQLGGVAHGTAPTVAAAASIPEMGEQPLDADGYVQATVSGLRAFGGSMYRLIDEAGKLGDQVTADIATEIARGVDKHAWFIGAHHG